jgi:hypothetical protein
MSGGKLSGFKLWLLCIVRGIKMVSVWFRSKGDMEDAYEALARIASPAQTYYTTEELLAQLASDNKTS